MCVVAPSGATPGKGRGWHCAALKVILRPRRCFEFCFFFVLRLICSFIAALFEGKLGLGVGGWRSACRVEEFYFIGLHSLSAKSTNIAVGIPGPARTFAEIIILCTRCPIFHHYMTGFCALFGAAVLFTKDSSPMHLIRQENSLKF